MSKESVKADTLTKWLLAPVLAFFMGTLFLARTTSSLSAAFLLPAALVILSSYGMFLMAARKRVARFVRMYVNNLFYVNADETSSQAMGRSFFSGAVTAFILFLFSKRLSLLISGSVKAVWGFRISLLFLLLHALEAALTGFAEGAGKRTMVLGLEVVRALGMFFLPVIAGHYGFLYGKKLDTLLLTDDGGALYAALFAILALFLFDVVLLLFLLVVRMSLLSGMRKSKKTKPRYLGDEPAFFRACGQLMAACALPQVLMALACICYTAFTPQDTYQPQTIAAVSLRFYYAALCLGLLVSLRFTGACYRLPGLSDEIESGGMLIRFRRLLHRMSLALPIQCALVAVLSAPLSAALFMTETENGSAYVLAGGLYSAMICAFAVFCLLLSLTRRRRQLAVLSVVSVLCCAVLLFVFERILLFGIAGMIAAQMLSLLVFTVGACTVLSDLMEEKRAKFYQMLVRPAILSAASALVLYPLQAELVHVIGEMATCVICVVAGLTIYLVLTAFFRGFQKGDLLSFPFGRELVSFSLRDRR